MAGREELPVTYRTRMVETLGLSLRIVTQPDFDTCPLVAICNALLLRNFSFLDPSAEEVSREELRNLVGQAVVDLNSDVQNESEEQAIIREQNVNFDLLQLNRLARQTDMVARSTKIDDFEHTPELEIFNHLKLCPYHGWVVDPQDTVDSAAGTGVASPDFAEGSDSHDSSHSPVRRRRGDEQELEELAMAIRLSLDPPPPPSSGFDWSGTYSPDSSYSTEIENSESEDDHSVSVSSEYDLVRALRESLDPISSDYDCSGTYSESEVGGDSVSEASSGSHELPVSNDGEDSAGEVVEDSLENNGNQLTVYGLDCLKKEIREKDPRVFFCNNRFSTIVKFNGELYLLATGDEYINKPDFVWMKLDEMYPVNSDRMLMTGMFEEVQVVQENSSPPDVSGTSLDIQGASMLEDSANEGNP